MGGFGAQGRRVDIGHHCRLSGRPDVRLDGPEPELVTCERRSMRLTAGGCARLFVSAADDPPGSWEGRAACVGCPFGAARAGRPTPPVHAPVGVRFCFRCERPAERVIQERVCVSCYNREREALGCAASAKTKRKPGIRDLRARLARREFVVIVDGVARTATTPPTRDLREAIALATRKLDAGVIGQPRIVWPAEMVAPRRGCPHSEDTKRRISEAQRGRVFSDQHRAKLRAASASRWATARASIAA